MAWLGYLPIPGLALVPVLLHPGDRLARYHAWQATVQVVGLLVALVAVGFLARSTPKSAQGAVGLLAGVLLLAGVVQLVLGAVGAALGRYPRLRPAWDVASALRR